MRCSILAIVILVGFGCVPVFAEQPKALSVEWKDVWKTPDSIHLPVLDAPSSTTFSLPSVDLKSGFACLRFSARLNYKTPAGWNNYLLIEIDGKPVGKTGESGPRLLNRKELFETNSPAHPCESMVQERDGKPCLNLFFGPVDAPLPESILTDRDEGYWYLLNVSDLFVGADEHVVKLTNLAKASYWESGPPKELELTIDSLSLGTVSQEAIAQLRDSSIIKREPGGGTSLPGEGVVAALCDGGALQIDLNSETYYVESAFSFPGENKIGWNRLNWKNADAEVWASPITRSGDSLVVNGKSSAYTFERRVTRHGNHIEINDSFTNTTDDVIGVQATYQVISAQWPQKTVLSGLDSIPNPPSFTPENPTTFIAQKQSGLGTVVEDDAFRLQYFNGLQENSARFGTLQLGIPPKSSYVLRWAIYPGSPDYFDFVNAVRRNWNVNFTIDGPWDFFDVRPLSTPEGRDAARELLARKKLKIFALTPWFEYYNGWGTDRNKFKNMMMEAREFIRSVVPNAQFQACVETNLSPVPLTTFKDTIPKENWPIGRSAGGKYGQIATPEMTACINALPWFDSCQRNASGNLLLDCWYVQYYDNETPALNLMVYPEIIPEDASPWRTQEYALKKLPYMNYRCREALEQFAWLLDDVGFDGLYIDQFSMAFNTGDIRYTKERWDGCTVTIDAKGRVVEKIADTGKLGAEARREWIRSILDRGKTVVANTTPAVEETQSQHAWRFMETQGYDPLAGEIPYQPTLAKGQLASPIGLGHSFPSNGSAEFFMRTVIAHLHFGLLYYYYGCKFPADGELGGEFGPVNHMFPFTPVELHDGWILGEERLITCRSGHYEWRGEKKPDVLLFDAHGRDKSIQPSISGDSGKWKIDIQLTDWREIAVVEAP
jgi:hypothetical protein